MNVLVDMTNNRWQTIVFECYKISRGPERKDTHSFPRHSELVAVSTLNMVKKKTLPAAVYEAETSILRLAGH